MKRVLISIKPKWCELIAIGKKIIEVRKTKPKLELPFRCYIYCTKEKTNGDFILCKSKENSDLFGFNAAVGINKGFANEADLQLKGKVIGEFICDEITDAIDIGGSEFYAASCMDIAEWLKYTDGHKGKVWCWHISELKMYDKPKELDEFRKYLSFFDGESIDEIEEAGISNIRLKRPPQSWCYAEEAK